jgi:hypothetical protein
MGFLYTSHSKLVQEAARSPFTITVGKETADLSSHANALSIFMNIDIGLDLFELAMGAVEPIRVSVYFES